MTNLYRLIAALFFSLLSLNCFSGIPKVTGYKISTGSSGIIYHSVPELCSSSEAQSYAKNYPNSRGTSSKSTHYAEYGPGIGTQSVNCYIWGLNKVDGSPVWLAGLPYSPSGKVCPSNSSPSGDECVCNEGYEEKNGNSCEKAEEPDPPDPCDGLEAYCAAKQNEKYDWVVKGKSKYRDFTCQPAQSWVSGIGDGATGYVDDFPGCNRGCMGAASGFSTSYQDDAGEWATTGQGKYSGSICDPSVIADLNGEKVDEEKPPELDKNSDKTCSNGFKGSVNGVSVCVPPKASSGITKLETTDNGDGTTTESKTQVHCENDRCAVTKTTTTTNNETNNVVSNSSTTTTVEKSSYCAENKNANVCKEPGESKGGGTGEDQEDGKGDGKGEFGGSCESGFTCDGDAIQCSIAKSQHETSCKLLEPAPKEMIFDGTEEGSAQDLQNNATVINVQTDLDYSGLGWNRSCPVDEEFDLGFANGKMTVPYSKLCAIFSPMSDIALAITALGLLAWLVAGKKEG